MRPIVEGKFNRINRQLTRMRKTLLDLEELATGKAESQLIDEAGKAISNLRELLLSAETKESTRGAKKKNVAK